MMSAAELRAALVPTWSRIEVVAETGSTNADLLADPVAPDRSVLVAEHQTAGRGRLDRSWTAPPGASLTFSVLIRPPAPVSTWGWLPLLTGLALREAVVAVTGVQAGLKWPNDLLIGVPQRKVAGILAQSRGDAVVVGIGLNVSTAAMDLPVPSATSLTLGGARDVDHAALLIATLTRLDVRLSEWSAAGGDAQACGLADAYRAACLTLGQRVSVSTTAGQSIAGTAAGLDPTGRLLVDTGGATTAVGAGGVHHLRPESSAGTS